MSGPDADGPLLEEEDEGQETEPSFFEDPVRIAQTVVAVLIVVAAIYFLFPKLVGIEDGIRELGDGDPVWITIALAFSLLDVRLVRRPLQGRRSASSSTCAGARATRSRWPGLAATRLFSAGGAGGIVLTYWALRKAAMPARGSRRPGWWRSSSCSTRSTCSRC